MPAQLAEQACALHSQSIKGKERSADDTVIQKRWRAWDLPAQLSAGCPRYKLVGGGVCVLLYACLFLSGGGGGGSGSLELAPDHPQNKGRAVLLKSRTEAKLLPPEKGGNKGGPVAWRGAAGLEWLPGVLWVWCSVRPILCWSTAWAQTQTHEGGKSLPFRFGYMPFVVSAVWKFTLLMSLRHRSLQFRNQTVPLG